VAFFSWVAEMPFFCVCRRRRVRWRASSWTRRTQGRCRCTRSILTPRTSMT
jgi:hypothetical protein